ncbi:PAS domain S-box protein [Nostoc commune]|uniref:PAS domain S-box protein n=1 Tax=Nostoc commune TaxID=1178 RepID=UPI0018C73DC5|nr:PAS domain S-box protein [Nostoc commune]
MESQFFSEAKRGTSLDHLKAQEVTDLRQYLGEQEQVEENLRHSEARYRSLAEASASIVWNAGPWGNVVEDIPTWEAFTGQSPEQYKGWGWVDALHPDDRTSVTTIWRQAFFGRREHRERRNREDYTGALFALLSPARTPPTFLGSILV